MEETLGVHKFNLPHSANLKWLISLQRVFICHLTQTNVRAVLWRARKQRTSHFPLEASHYSSHTGSGLSPSDYAGNTFSSNNNIYIWNWTCSSVVDHLPSMCEALGWIPRTRGQGFHVTVLVLHNKPAWSCNSVSNSQDWGSKVETKNLKMLALKVCLAPHQCQGIESAPWADHVRNRRAYWCLSIMSEFIE